MKNLLEYPLYRFGIVNIELNWTYAIQQPPFQIIIFKFVYMTIQNSCLEMNNFGNNCLYTYYIIIGNRKVEV